MAQPDSPPASTPQPQPAVVRLPRSGKTEPYSGLKRTQLDMVTRPQPGNNFDPPVKSHIMAAHGNSRGIRLINLVSLLAYVNGLSNTQPKKKQPSVKRRRVK
jgi:hypothetical protein